MGVIHIDHRDDPRRRRFPRSVHSGPPPGPPGRQGTRHRRGHRRGVPAAGVPVPGTGAAGRRTAVRRAGGRPRPGRTCPSTSTSAEVMADVVGFHLNRGILAVADRPAPLDGFRSRGRRRHDRRPGRRGGPRKPRLALPQRGRARRRRCPARTRLLRPAVPAQRARVDGPRPAGAVRVPARTGRAGSTTCGRTGSRSPRSPRDRARFRCASCGSTRPAGWRCCSAPKVPD